MLLLLTTRRACRSRSEAYRCSIRFGCVAGPMNLRPAASALRGKLFQILIEIEQRFVLDARALQCATLPNSAALAAAADLRRLPNSDVACFNAPRKLRIIQRRPRIRVKGFAG